VKTRQEMNMFAFHRNLPIHNNISQLIDNAIVHNVSNTCTCSHDVEAANISNTEQTKDFHEENIDCASTSTIKYIPHLHAHMGLLDINLFGIKRGLAQNRAYHVGIPPEYSRADDAV
jgi:hypothetical protein